MDSMLEANLEVVREETTIVQDYETYGAQVRNSRFTAKSTVGGNRPSPRRLDLTHAADAGSWDLYDAPDDHTVFVLLFPQVIEAIRRPETRTGK